MRLLFWLCLIVVGYTYIGYALLLGVLARLRPKPVAASSLWQPSVSIVLAVHNEEANLERKLTSLYALTYPSAKVQIVIASDGSTDRTNSMLERHAARVQPVLLPRPEGKANALNHAVTHASGEVLVFMDARQSIDPDAVSQLVACLADPTVGAVSGELHLEAADGQPSPDALGIYWKIEKTVRKLESITGSVIGVTGALFAMRRELYVPLPSGTLLDDVLTPMQVTRAGKRVLFLENAIARDRIFSDKGKEFSRKVRTLTGNYQLVQLAPWLLSWRNPLLFRLVSHKLLRLVIPFVLVLMLVCSAVSGGVVYRGLLLVQLLVYVLSLAGAWQPRFRRHRLISVPYTFVMLNVAAAAAFYNFITGRARWA